MYGQSKNERKGTPTPPITKPCDNSLASYKYNKLFVVYFLFITSKEREFEFKFIE